MDSMKQGGKVRVIARIRGSAEEVPAAASVSVRKVQSEPSGSGRAVLSFAGDQTTSKQFNYEVDACYGQDARNDVIYSEEIKPLISSVFGGTNATVFAYGARGSGKTYTIQGLENVPGLITLSMPEFLTQAEKVGNSISVSFYEVVQDHVFDILDVKRPEISVLEDAKGKIILKGLSKVTVKSISEFHKLYLAVLRKSSLKTANAPSQRSHIGITINVLSDSSLLGRMNLVDLAGYEDRKQSCSGANLISLSKINKSLYAVHNVLNAFIRKETRVPYRESKLTRMLQGSLGGLNKILMITCVDSSFPEDTVKALSVACRLSQVSNKTKVDDMTRVRSSIKTMARPSNSVSKPAVVRSSKVEKVASSSASTRKQVRSAFHSVENKSQSIKMEGRKLFGKRNESDNPKKENVPRKNRNVPEAPIEEEEKIKIVDVEEKIRVPDAATGTEPSLDAPMEVEVGDVLKNTIDAEQEKEDVLKNTIDAEQEKEDVLKNTIDAEQEMGDVLKNSVGANQVNSVINPTPETSDATQAVETNPINETSVANHTLMTPNITLSDKENQSLAMNEGQSPPLSVRLQELSNNLKSLWTTPTPASTKIVQENCDSINNNMLGNDTLEPSTPLTQPIQSAKDRSQYSNMMSPWERFHVRSSGMKDSLVQELLNLLNTASKEELMGLKGIGEARATYVLTLREESSEPFKNLDDLKKIGLSSKQINGMIRKIAGDFFA